jgi:hypothetical protein
MKPIGFDDSPSAHQAPPPANYLSHSNRYHYGGNHHQELESGHVIVSLFMANWIEMVSTASIDNHRESIAAFQHSRAAKTACGVKQQSTLA